MGWWGWHGDIGRERSRPTRPAWPTLKRATGLLAPYRLLVIGYLVAISLTSLIGLLPPLLIGRITKAIVDGHASTLDLLCLWLLGVIVISALLSVVQTYMNNLNAQVVMFDLRDKLYRHLSGMSLRWFTSTRTGEVLSRVSSDVSAIQGVMSDTIGSILGSLITVVSTLAVMAALDWRLAALSLLVVVFVVPARRVGQATRALTGEVQQQTAQMTSQMQETLSVSGALLVKTFGRIKEEGKTFAETAGAIRDLNIRRAMIGRWFQVSVSLFGQVAPAIVFWYGGHRVIDHETDIASVIAISLLLPRLFGPLAQLLSVNVNVLSSIALFERVFDYLDLPHDITDKPGAIELDNVRGAVSFDHVSFSYLPGQETLSDISFDVKPGEFVALVGPTGAGKTTLAHLVPRLYDVDAGAVRVDGHDVRDLTLESLTAAIAMVNQEPFLFHSSIGKNLLYARLEATNDEMIAAAKAANIHDFIAGLPDGYDTVVGERGYRLSGGEQQRVAIARAILKDPAILILDEATSSVDSATERAIQDALDHLTRGRTVLAIAHRLSTVLAADLILVVDHGRIVERGRHEDLLAQGGLYARLYEQQFTARERSPEVTFIGKPPLDVGAEDPLSLAKGEG